MQRIRQIDRLKNRQRKVYHGYCLYIGREAVQAGYSKHDMDTGKVYSGQPLQNGGMILERQWGDFWARLIWLKQQ